MFLNILQLPFNNLLSLFRDRKVVLLGDLASGVAHLVAEQVGGSILFSEAGAVGMAQVVVLEVYAEGFLDFLRVVFHRIDGLDFAVWEAIYKLEGGEGRAGCVGDDGLVLITNLCIGLIGGVGCFLKCLLLAFIVPPISVGWRVSHNRLPLWLRL